MSRREAGAWIAAFLLVAALVVRVGFASEDPDSALYAALSERLAELPPSEWIVPSWWGLWDGVGLFREHPAGMLVPPAALGALGIPARQAAYVMGIGYGLASLLLIGWLVARIASPREGRWTLVLLQLMPVAFVFRIRANHEYPMLLCLLAAIVALDGVRRSWWWLPAVAAAITAALLIKGVFVAIVLLGAGLWALLNPLRAPGSMIRPLVALAVAVGCAAAMAVGYDVLYERAAGTTFWAGYWRRQLGPVAEAAPGAGVLPILGHIGFYVAHLAWLSAPWGAALVGLTIVWCWRARDQWRRMPAPLRGTLVFALAFAAASILMLSPSGRFAERYLFSPFFVSAAAGVAAACYAWPGLAAFVERLDRRIPALPALLWLVLMVGRLGFGPLLPRPRFW